MTAEQKFRNTQWAFLIFGVPCLAGWLLSFILPGPPEVGWWMLWAAYALFTAWLYHGKEKGFPALFLGLSGVFAGLLRLNYLFWGNWLLAGIGWFALIVLSIFIALSCAFPYHDDPGPAMDDQYDPDGGWLEPPQPPRRLRAHPRRT